MRPTLHMKRAGFRGGGVPRPARGEDPYFDWRRHDGVGCRNGSPTGFGKKWWHRMEPAPDGATTERCQGADAGDRRRAADAGKVRSEQAKHVTEAFCRGRPHKAVILATVARDKINQLR